MWPFRRNKTYRLVKRSFLDYHLEFIPDNITYHVDYKNFLGIWKVLPNYNFKGSLEESKAKRFFGKVLELNGVIDFSKAIYLETILQEEIVE
jgi:hypothetical protein